MIIAVATLVVDCQAAFGDVFTVDNSTSGAAQFLDFPNALSLSFPTYFAGFNLGESHPYLDYFSFDLSGVTGTVLAATFNVFTYHTSNSSTDVFGSNQGTYGLFGATLGPEDNLVIGSDELGSIALSQLHDNTTAHIKLNAAGLAFLTANEGNPNTYLTGALVDCACGGNNFAFGGSVFTPSNRLDIIATSTTPEPSSLLPLCAGLAGLVQLIRRRLKG
jgi:hypothetical protein